MSYYEKTADYFILDLDSIPLPLTPAPVVSTRAPLDTVDSFEVLEQTILKQKKLTRGKKSMDMRCKLLLKRTFDLVCAIMDRENGFDEVEEAHSSPPPPVPVPVVTQEVPLELELCAERDLDFETYLAESELHVEITNSNSINYEITLKLDEGFFKHQTLDDNRKRRRCSQDDDDREDQTVSYPVYRLPRRSTVQQRSVYQNKKKRVC